MGPESIAHVLRRAAGQASPLWVDAAGPSMQPAIPAGARVRVVPAPRPRWGEVWAFCDPEGKVVVHRCLRRKGSLFLFRGDAARTRDEPVPAERLVGRVTEVEADGRRRALGAVDRGRGALRLFVVGRPRPGGE